MNSTISYSSNFHFVRVNPTKAVHKSASITNHENAHQQKKEYSIYQPTTATALATTTIQLNGKYALLPKKKTKLFKLTTIPFTLSHRRVHRIREAKELSWKYSASDWRTRAYYHLIKFVMAPSVTAFIIRIFLLRCTAARNKNILLWNMRKMKNVVYIGREREREYGQRWEKQVSSTLFIESLNKFETNARMHGCMAAKREF